MTVSAQEAELVLECIKADYPMDAEYFHLYDHTHEEQPEGAWCVWGEEAEYEWALKFSEKQRFRRLLLEPINRQCLGIYRA